MIHPAFRSLTGRLMCLFALLLLIFMLILGLFYNTFMERQMISHYSKTMQRNAYAIAQSLSEMIAPSPFKTLDENPFVVGEDTLSPYMALSILQAATSISSMRSTMSPGTLTA